MHDNEADASRYDEPAGITYLRERIGQIPIGEMILAGPRTAQFLTRSASRHLRKGDHRYPDIPTRLMTFGTALSVLVDELMLAYMATTRLNLGDADLDRIAQETVAAIERLEREGIFDDPRRLHPAPDPPVVRTRRRVYRGVRYEHVTFESGYRPALDLPGASRWLSIGSNQLAHAYVLRHRRPSPWIVNLHGFGMGHPADLLALRALHYHRDLGLNVIQPVFPVHGPRSAGPDGEQALALDYLNNLHAVSQAVWDARRIMAWARAEHGDARFAIHGVSMGGFTAALLAGLVDDLECVIAGVPTVDLAWVMRRSVPDDERDALDARGLLGAMADRIHQPISPLSFAPRLPVSRRFVYAGVADRMATPGQAHRLWEHWGHAPVLWYRGSHIGFAWSREVRQFIDDALRHSGLLRTRSK
ncbi:MAG: hypothetical protein R3F35_12850 [Myxococcota bacterium]